MKKSIALLLTIAAWNAQADLADVKDVASKAQVSNTCAKKILAQATKQCNHDSLASEGADRMHECFYSNELSDVENGVLNICFTAGDADEYNYSVQVTDEADKNDCDFVIKSAN